MFDDAAPGFIAHPAMCVALAPQQFQSGISLSSTPRYLHTALRDMLKSLPVLCMLHPG